MRFIHLADLHLGKRLAEYSLLEDQEHILRQIISVIDREKIDVVIVAGDIFDKGIPTEDALRLWDYFLREIVKRNLQLFAISGNHDSAVRFSAYSALFHKAGIHFSEPYGGRLERFTVQDGAGKVNIFLLPYIKPSAIRILFEDKEINSYMDAVGCVLANENINSDERNIIVSHQFVTGGERSDSEEQIGTIENIDASLYAAFDYVALGHLHKAQSVARNTIRYCGSPIKYSLSEKDHKKSVTIADFKEKGDLSLKEIELKPLRDIVEKRGTLEELLSVSKPGGEPVRDFVYAVLTDEDEKINAQGRLRSVYPNLAGLRYDNTRTRMISAIDFITDVEEKSPFELFSAFFKTQNNVDLNSMQKECLNEIIEKLQEKHLSGENRL